MVEIQGVAQLDRVLDKFLEEFECTAELGPDFCCYMTSNRIVYSLVVAEKNSQTFMARVKRLYPDITADEFLWSFLHEVGHIETCDDLTEDEWIYSTRIKDDTENITDEIYYELPDEFAATEWAARYMRAHADKVAAFWKEVQQAILDIYSLNGIK